MKTLKNKAKKGFTIVELVIVIAVIAILAAVLIPTFTSVVTNAKETAAMEECRNEWVNYLTEIATTADYEDTYYVTYDADYESSGTYSADYYFVVTKAQFDTTVNSATGKTFTTAAKKADGKTDYTCENSKVLIYTSISS